MLQQAGVQISSAFAEHFHAFFKTRMSLVNYLRLERAARMLANSTRR